MKKVLVICGTTATGKTALAWEIANRLNGELISADSRQIYRGMDIVTGKDIPHGALFTECEQDPRGFSLGYYEHSTGKKIWGHDAVEPDGEWNAAYFAIMGKKLIDRIHQDEALPILVGGTGWYLQALFDPPESLMIPPNQELRDSLKGTSPSDLFMMLEKISPLRAERMNVSDKRNPYRLIRAIEIETSKYEGKASFVEKTMWDVCWIGLTYEDRTHLYSQIDARVRARLTAGIAETRTLQQRGFPANVLAKTIGYAQILDFLTGHCNEDELYHQWRYAEHAYARRQLTWFRKQPSISWSMVDALDYKSSIFDRVTAWYSQG